MAAPVILRLANKLTHCALSLAQTAFEWPECAKYGHSRRHNSNRPPRHIDIILTDCDPCSMKERILSEIKRIASENGGIAPGKNLFQRETGI